MKWATSLSPFFFFFFFTYEIGTWCFVQACGYLALMTDTVRNPGSDRHGEEGRPESRKAGPAALASLP